MEWSFTACTTHASASLSVEKTHRSMVRDIFSKAGKSTISVYAPFLTSGSVALTIFTVKKKTACLYQGHQKIGCSNYRSTQGHQMRKGMITNHPSHLKYLTQRLHKRSRNVTDCDYSQRILSTINNNSFPNHHPISTACADTAEFNGATYPSIYFYQWKRAPFFRLPQ